MNESKSNAQERTELQITVCENGVINCRNPKYDSGHTYSVFVDDGTAIRCSCQGHRYHGHCYHADEVESRPLVVSSAESLAESYKTVATDGGKTEDDSQFEPEITHHREAEYHGGQRYARCEGCGSESVEDSDGDTSILHDDDCPRRDDNRDTDDTRGVVDPYPNDEEVNTTPL